MGKVNAVPFFNAAEEHLIAYVNLISTYKSRPFTSLPRVYILYCAVECYLKYYLLSISTNVKLNHDILDLLINIKNIDKDFISDDIFNQIISYQYVEDGFLNDDEIVTFYLLNEYNVDIRYGFTDKRTKFKGPKYFTENIGCIIDIITSVRKKGITECRDKIFHAMEISDNVEIRNKLSTFLV